MMTVARGHVFRRQLSVGRFVGESADLAGCLSQFERVARWNGWSHEEKGIQLALNRGAAQQVLGCLTDFEVDNYDVLCSVLKERFSPKERVPMCLSEFRNRNKFKRESVSDFGFTLSRLVNMVICQEMREILSLLSNLFMD